MTTALKSRIIKKNLDFSSKFNGYLVRTEKTDILPNNSCVIFKDSKDPVFSASNAKIAATITTDGGHCVVVEPRNGRWFIETYSQPRRI